ncbi:MAG TPA: aldo/keto reductase [Actinomycetota bacterium]
MNEIPTITLANGVAMPALGLGTSPMGDRQAEETVSAALRAGYRLIDTAENYRNETGVGRGIRASGVDRDEVFVTTKLNARWHGEAEAQQAWANSAERLGLDRIDLYLIHWPNPGKDRYVEAWRGLLRLLEDGKVRAIGVSNFKPPHLDQLLDETGVTPHVNQIQLDPRIGRAEERAYHEAHGIVTESWSPIGAGGDLLRAPTIVEVARRRSKTPAQVVLRWHVQLGLLPIPKTSKAERLPENRDVFDFQLDETDMDELAALDRGDEGVVDADRFGH